MDDEQQKRRDFITQIRFNNKVDMQADKMELIHRVSKMKGPDRVAQWREDSEQRQRQHEEERAALTEQQHEQVASVEQMIRTAIAQAIVEERTFLVQIIGAALAEALDAEREEQKSELATEVRRLWSVLSEMQATIAAYNRAAAATGKTPIDLPNPLSSRSH